VRRDLTTGNRGKQMNNLTLQ